MITIDVKQVLIGLLLLAAVILVIFLIVMVANLITTLKKVNGILDDTSAVTTIVHEKAEETKPLVDELSGAVMSFAGAMKGQFHYVPVFPVRLDLQHLQGPFFNGLRDQKQQKVT